MTEEKPLIKSTESENALQRYVVHYLYCPHLCRQDRNIDRALCCILKCFACMK